MQRVVGWWVGWFTDGFRPWIAPSALVWHGTAYLPALQCASSDADAVRSCHDGRRIACKLVRLVTVGLGCTCPGMRSGWSARAGAVGPATASSILRVQVPADKKVRRNCACNWQWHYKYSVPLSAFPSGTSDTVSNDLDTVSRYGWPGGGARRSRLTREPGVAGAKPKEAGAEHGVRSSRQFARLWMDYKLNIRFFSLAPLFQPHPSDSLLPPPHRSACLPHHHHHSPLTTTTPQIQCRP